MRLIRRKCGDTRQNSISNIFITDGTTKLRRCFSTSYGSKRSVDHKKLCKFRLWCRHILPDMLLRKQFWGQNVISNMFIADGTTRIRWCFLTSYGSKLSVDHNKLYKLRLWCRHISPDMLMLAPHQANQAEMWRHKAKLNIQYFYNGWYYEAP